jgi:hypothetical protein
MNKPKKLRIPLNQLQSAIQFDTASVFFSRAGRSRVRSAYSLFKENQRELNQMIKPESESLKCLLVLLGHISCVESYFRKMISDVIEIDPTSRQNCLSCEISIGSAWAALKKPSDTQALVEAMLEQTTFSGSWNIQESLNKYLDIPKQTVIQELGAILEQFSRLCQLRHCSVHRFGFLGSKNAIDLGFEDHSKYIGNRLYLNNNHVEDISSICYNLVSATNTLVYSVIISRRIEDPPIWTWKFQSDRNRFLKVLSIFHEDLTPQEVKRQYLTLKTTYHAN